MVQPSEELLEKLAGPDVTLDDVMELLFIHECNFLETGHLSEDMHMSQQEFITEQDLLNYKRAMEWWPKFPSLPAVYAPPSIYQLCWNYFEGPAFSKRLLQKGQPVTEWLQENGYNVDRPNETTEERKARLNAEAQRRHRAKRSAVTTMSKESALAVAEAYKEYMDICRQRREVTVEWNSKVSAAHKAWRDAKEAAMKGPANGTPE